MSVKIYVEGGGDSRGQQAPLRRAFSKLLRQFEGRMPSIVCGGSRLAAFNEFKRAFVDIGNSAMLLVDAEGPVSGDDAWVHVASRQGDRWPRPIGAKDDQLHLMVELMESWFLADRAELANYFGTGFAVNKLPGTESQIEPIQKLDVLTALKKATLASRKGEYHKGKHSAELLGNIDPNKLKHSSPGFAALLMAIEARVGVGSERK